MLLKFIEEIFGGTQSEYLGTRQGKGKKWAESVWGQDGKKTRGKKIKQNQKGFLTLPTHDVSGIDFQSNPIQFHLKIETKLGV